ncbi:hypothetical protein KA005_11460 [bacterium]|nr:hypothetical protein [bacterium]
MDNVWLGPSGSETKLPALYFMGNPPSWPVSTGKEIKKAKMSDGSIKVAFFGTRKIFQIAYGFLTTAQLETFKALNELKQILRYKNEHEEDVWYNVVITEFSHDPERMDIRQLDRYKISMTLEETDSSLRA